MEVLLQGAAEEPLRRKQEKINGPPTTNPIRKVSSEDLNSIKMQRRYANICQISVYNITDVTE